MDDFAQSAALWFIVGVLFAVPAVVVVSMMGRKRDDKDLAKRATSRRGIWGMRR